MRGLSRYPGQLVQDGTMAAMAMQHLNSPSSWLELWNVQDLVLRLLLLAASPRLPGRTAGPWNKVPSLSSDWPRLSMGKQPESHRQIPYPFTSMQLKLRKSERKMTEIQCTQVRMVLVLMLIKLGSSPVLFFP